MTAPAVVLVEVETPGNVGTVARAMKNFGFERLILVDPPPLDPDGEAYGFAGRAREDILPQHETMSFERVCRTFFTVGFTAVPGRDASDHARYPADPPAILHDDLPTGSVAFVFGRERIGLTNDELARMDRLCSIPADPEYPTLNLGQAATIACYACRALALETDQFPEPRYERVEPVELEHFYDRVSTVLEAIDYPEEKRPKTERMVRRLLGRANPTVREIRTAHGVLRRVERRLRGWSPDAPSEVDEGRNG